MQFCWEWKNTFKNIQEGYANKFNGRQHQSTHFIREEYTKGDQICCSSTESIKAGGGRYLSIDGNGRGSNYAMQKHRVNEIKTKDMFCFKKNVST